MVNNTKINAFINKLTTKFVSKNQGNTNNGKFLKINSSGNIEPTSVTIPTKNSQLINDTLMHNNNLGNGLSTLQNIEDYASYILDASGNGDYTTLYELYQDNVVSDGDIIYVRGGTYQLSTNSPFQKLISIIGDPSNRPEFACKPNSGNGGIYYFQIGSQNTGQTVQIRNIDFIGHGNAALNINGEKAFEITNYGTTIIDNCTFKYIWYPWHGCIRVNVVNTSNVLINNNRFINCQSKGYGNMESNIRILGTACNQLLVTNNYFDKRNRFGSAYNSAGSVVVTQSESSNTSPTINHKLAYGNIYVTPNYDYNYNLTETSNDDDFIYQLSLFTSDFVTYYYNTKNMTNICDIIYPVGSIYISGNPSDPAGLFGGTWERIAQGRTLIGEGSGTDSRSETKTFNKDETGGEYNHLLTVNEIPPHKHRLGRRNDSILGRTDSGSLWYIDLGTTDIWVDSGSIENTGGGQVHNNLPPYLTVYIWKRIR